MKNKVTALKLSFLLAFSFASVSSFSQTLSFGGKTGYVTYHRTYAPSIQIEGTQIYKPINSTSFRDGWRFAFFSQIENMRFSGKAELAYTYNLGGDDLIIINNWNNPSNEDPADDWAMGKSTSFQNWEFSLIGGYKIYNWLTFKTGAGLWHQQYQNSKELKLVDDQHGRSTEPYDRNFNKRNKLEYAIQESFVPWVITGSLELEAALKQFLICIAYDRSLSAIGKYLEYENRQYFFRQSADRYVVSIGYLIPTKISLKKK